MQGVNGILVNQQILFESIINFTDDAILTKTLDGIVTSWNRGAEILFGYEAEEMIGRHISAIIPAEYLHEEQEIISKIKKGEQIKHYETVRVKKNGERVNIS